MGDELTDATLDVVAIISRSGIGWRVTYSPVAAVVAGVVAEPTDFSVAVAPTRVGSGVHAITAIDPDDPLNISVLLAFE